MNNKERNKAIKMVKGWEEDKLELLKRHTYDLRFENPISEFTEFFKITNEDLEKVKTPQGSIPKIDIEFIKRLEDRLEMESYFNKRKKYRPLYKRLFSKLFGIDLK